MTFKTIWMAGVLMAAASPSFAQDRGGGLHGFPTASTGGRAPGAGYSGPSAPERQDTYIAPPVQSAPPPITATPAPTPTPNYTAPRTTQSYTYTPQPNYQVSQNAARAQQQAQQQYQYREQQAQAAQSAQVQRQYQAQSDRANAALMQTPTFGAAPAVTVDSSTMNSLSCDATCRFNQAMAGR